MSKQAITALAVGVLVPTSTAITLAATGTFNHSAVAASSVASSSNYSSSSTTSSTNSVVSNMTTASDTASSNAISSSPKRSDNVASDIDAINQATAEGLDKINSAASKAIGDINSAKEAAPPSSAPSSNPASSKNNQFYNIPDPNNQKRGIDVEDSDYQTAVDTYNAYAKSKGVEQDAGAWSKEKYYCYKSEAILLWAKDHGWVINK